MFYSVCVSIIILVFHQNAWAQNLGNQQSIPIPKIGGILGWSVDQVGKQVNLTVNSVLINGTYQVQSPLGGPATCGDISPKYPIPPLSVVGGVGQVWAGTCSLKFCSSPSNPSAGVQGVNFDAYVWYYDPVVNKQPIMQFLDHSRSFWTSLPCQ